MSRAEWKRLPAETVTKWLAFYAGRESLREEL